MSPRRPGLTAMISNSPQQQMTNDNARARLCHWSARRGPVDPSAPIPADLPAIPESLPWDPDPRFDEILALTQTDRLDEALALVEAIPPSDREVLFDEVIYLRYLVGQPLRGDDIRYLARKHVVGSAIRALIEESFAAFIGYLDEALANSRQPSESLGFDWMTDIQLDPDPLKRRTPALSDWSATRAHYYAQLAAYGHPVRPRGRIFVWHPDIASRLPRRLLRVFEPEMVAAENAFRRARGIAEIGRGWSSETALVDLVRSVRPDAIHQWRPHFLGSQSVDIYVPSMNLAIEYQGEQHFRPIRVFGGKEGFAATRARDARKRAVLEANGVKLLEWRYDHPVLRAEVEAKLASISR